MKVTSLSLGFFALLTVLLTSCAGAKIQSETTPLKEGAFSKADTIYVKPISADQATFSGDRSGDVTRVNEEKSVIKQRLSSEIIAQLKKRGFKAAPWSASQNGVVLHGTVTKFEHGSAAARGFVGMGAGSSNLFVPMKLSKGRETIAEFEVVATSGGRGGVFSMSSFMDAHISDAGEKTAEYIAKRVK